ncbi:MAG: hypothetical protein H0U74_18920 [Bradymonadaceae bacterium]|nr:hypothetical protein [Lujinxingiaceae bacterium]
MKTYKLRLKRATLICALALLPACADMGDRSYDSPSGSSNNGNNSDGSNNSNNAPFIPEDKVEFSFSKPAIVAETIFVANETLNSVAVIDSRNLSVTTVLAGFRPTAVVGPEPAFATSSAARVMALNEGSNSVTIIDPATFATRTVAVLPHANALAIDPSGRYGVAWYDDARAQSGQRAGDLSSVSIIMGERSVSVAVGFHVRRVHFDRTGELLLVLTDDGISRIELASLVADSFAAPIAIVSPNLRQIKPVDLEVVISRDAKYAVTRTTAWKGLVLLDIEAREQHLIALPETPTDIEFVERDGLEILAVLRNRSQIVRASVPQGLINAALWSADNALHTQVVGSSHGEGDVGLSDAGDAGDAGDDVGQLDTGASDDAGASDDTGVEVDTSIEPDVGVLDDASEGDASDAAVDDDATSEPGHWPDLDGFSYLDMIVAGLGAASISADGASALLFTTLGEERRSVLLGLEDNSQRALIFEKGIRGALSDERGNTFLVFHSKKDGPLPTTATPTDPEYIARSWGVSMLDVATAATRLVLTQQEPGPTTLWAPETGDARVFMVFKQPSLVSQIQDSHRDAVVINLRSFRTDAFRLPSLPEGLGVIASARKVYISQTHPQGRMSFVNVDTLERQTVTGYQLNAGIE